MSVMITLNVDGLRVLIVGGGSVARRRGLALADAGAQLTVVAPAIDADLAAAAESSDGQTHARAYTPDDLASVGLVVAATDDEQLNQQIAEHAAQRGIPANCASAPHAGRVGFVAERRVGDIQLGVTTNGTSAAAAASIATQLADHLADSAWPALLDVARDWRPRIQQSLPPGPARQAALRELTGPTARQRFAQGNAQALADYYASLVDQAAAPAPSGGER